METVSGIRIVSPLVYLEGKTIRTEVVEIGSIGTISVIPGELSVRWTAHNVVYVSVPPGLAAVSVIPTALSSFVVADESAVPGGLTPFVPASTQCSTASGRFEKKSYPVRLST